MFKYVLALFSILFSLEVVATEVTPRASDMKFVTTFTGYACRPFTDSAQAPAEIDTLNVEFTQLGISSNTRRVLMDVVSRDGECFYSADFSRKKGEKILNFETSYMSGSESCEVLKEALDEILAPGFKYAIKFNAYISLLFRKEGLTSECEQSTKLRLIEFEWQL